MSEALYAEHPAVYDALYAEKAYGAEVEFVREQFEARGNGGDRVLVVGCGTGEHSRLLDAAGFDVTGVDRYGAMVERARTKSDAAFRVGALPDLPVDGPFDLVWLPFTVVNHLPESDLVPAFEAIGDVLAEGGMLVSDAMYAAEMVGGPRLRCHAVDDGAYARILEVHDLGEDRYAWDSLVFTPDGGFFVDTHELTDYDPAFLEEVTAALGLSVARFGWYDADSGFEPGDAFVLVAWGGRPQ